MEYAAAVRTNCRRLMPNFRRTSSIFSFWRAMIFRWAGVGSGGTYSPFDAGMMSMGGASDGSGSYCLYFSAIQASPLRQRTSGGRAPKADAAAKPPRNDPCANVSADQVHFI